jgi:hypothetical protein
MTLGGKTMKKAIALLFAVLLILLTAGCATSIPVGLFYTDITIPVTATANVGKSTKIGTAKCKSYFGLVAVGDASIDRAVKKSGITKIYHIEWKANNVLGMLGTYEVVVYGE